MLTEQAVDRFGSKARIAKLLELTSGRPSQWGPVVHENSAPKLAIKSGGDLVYDPDFYKSLKANPLAWKKHLAAYRKSGAPEILRKKAAADIAAEEAEQVA